MKNYLNLIRWPNLLMIFIMQVLVRYALLQPILDHERKSVLMNSIEFFILVFSCLLIAGGGYIINDIEDLEIDRINKPEKLLIGTRLNYDLAYNLYMILTFIGVLGGFYLSFVKGYKNIAYINLVTAGLLYFYSTSYKCIPLLGNLIIALLSGFAVWIVLIPEPFDFLGSFAISMVVGYTVFAFLISMIRELIKDMEDIIGDEQFGCKTLPVLVGVKVTKAFTILLTLLLLFILIRFQTLSNEWVALKPFLIYLIITIEIPLLGLIVLISKADNVKSYANVSLITKMIMFAGILSMLVFYFSFH